ncbi:hypothetical protein M3J09_006171 [Ascochyta lentis]
MKKRRIRMRIRMMSPSRMVTTSRALSCAFVKAASTSASSAVAVGRYLAARSLTSSPGIFGGAVHVEMKVGAIRVGLMKLLRVWCRCWCWWLWTLIVGGLTSHLSHLSPLASC